LKTGSDRLNSRDLLRWINDRRPPNRAQYDAQSTVASRKRVIRILEAIQQVIADLSEHLARGTGRDYWGNCPPELEERIQNIDDLLFEYPTRPTLEIVGKDGRGGLYIDYATSPGRPIGEQCAIFAIRRLVNAGRLDRIRRCDCGNWFLAIRTDQLACSGRCRHRHYEQTVEAKTKRREYNRNYYILKNSGKVK
jgi:hypothetical protein